MASEFDMPTYRRPELVAVSEDLSLIHDLLGGTRRMHEQSVKYIRKWKWEDQGVFDIRRRIEKVYAGLERVLSASIGMLYAKPPQITWNQSEAAVKEHWDNIDTLGTKGEVFIKRFSEIGIRDGLALMLVDHTAPPNGVTVTAENEAALGLRPTWAMYERANILSWRLEKVNNQLTLTQIVLKECAEVPTGRFGTAKEDRYRELRLQAGMATWRLWRALKVNPQGGEDFQMIGGGVFRNHAGVPATKLPVRLAYCGTSGAPLVAKIPLLGVAWANLSHWQQSTNLRFYRELCAFPQPTVTGQLAQEPDGKGNMTSGKLRVGPMVAVHLNENGKFEWGELTGTSMEQLEKGISQEERHMSTLGMSFLVKDTRDAETAEAKRLDASAENSTLATCATGIEDCINGAFEDHAWYLGIEKAGAPTMAINRDYEDAAMDPATMAVYIEAIEKAGLPVRTLLEAWKAGGRLPADTDIEALEVEMMANMAAKKAEEQAIADAKTVKPPLAA